MAPPPPPKRIKRPPKVLDEDDYTRALSQIIARDFFPGLVETKSQKEYLDALDSNDPVWIAAAGKKLETAMTPGPRGRRAATRLNNDTVPILNPSFDNRTPQGWQGATPASVAASDETAAESQKSEINTTNLSLSAFQAKYTSEDNESFNSILDKQNFKRREISAYLWNDNKIPAPRQIAQRAREAGLLEASSDPNNNPNDNALALTTGATSSRPARPEAWKSKPDNSLMFQPSSIEDELETVAEKAQADSRAPPKQTLYHNTRLPPPSQPSSSAQEPPPSPSLSAVRSAIAGHPRGPASSLAAADTEDGSSTPRVNGYAFIDDEEPEPEPQPDTGPSYRDLLAGQTTAPSPFQIKENRKREDLHHRMVEKTMKKKREARAHTTPTPMTVPKFPSSPFVGGGRTASGGGGPAAVVGSGGGSGGGGMTPAAQRLLEKVGGKTPRIGMEESKEKGGNGSGSGLRNIWTPTPRRKGG